MATKTLLIFLIISIETTKCLTNSQEKRLIINEDLSVIDERLRELPGGVLLPPEIRQEKMPSMETIRNQESSPLEIALKRIEILSSRAGFNLSTVPRRTQLQIVKRISSKLPWKLENLVRKAIKEDLHKVYEHLPEPSRDPLVEDNYYDQIVNFHGENKNKEVSYHGDKNVNNHHGDKNKEVNYHDNDKQMLSSESINMPRSLSNQNHNHNYEEIEENQEIVIKRPKKHENKPIRVSIISKETPTQIPIITTTTEREVEEKKKYVQVQSFNNKTNLLFELNNEESGEDYDLSSMEISAMVEELKKFEERPHPLDFPDHPEHDSFGGKEMEELRRLREEKRRMSQQQQHPNNRQNARRPPPQQSPRQPQQPHPLLNTLKMAPPPITTTPCDHFTPSICLQANNYPTTEIQNSLENSLLRPPPENINNNHHDNAINPSDSGFLCPSKVAYGRIKKAKSSSSNNWKFVVNHGDYSQTLRIEKCLTPGASCSYVMPIYRTSCTQVYNYHRLLAWDEFKGLHLDVFKIPTVCTCHISGYYQKPPQSPQRRRLSPYPQQRFRFPQQPVPQPPQQPQQPREDPELSDLLKQYGNLRDKIQKKTSTQRMLKKLNYIETVLLRKKRKNENNPENLKKFLRKLKKKNKKLNNQELLKLAKRKLRMLPHSPKKNLRQSKSLKSLNVKKSSRMFRKLLNKIRRGN